MCIAILNESGKTISKKILRNCWDNNRDGAGMLYVNNGELFVHKEMQSFKKFYRAYQIARKNNMASKFVIHFRIATHGKIDETNCHPFFVNDNLGFVHNGIISGIPTSNDFSDTFMFNEHILKGLPTNFLNYDSILSLIFGFIGYSKLIFLDNENHHTIIGEAKGVWHEGNWYSNYTFEDSNYYDVGGKQVAKITQKPLWQPAYTPIYKSFYQSNPQGGWAVDSSASDFYDDADNDWEDKAQDLSECECCNLVAEETKYSSTYDTHVCRNCWNEYLAETELEDFDSCSY